MNTAASRCAWPSLRAGPLACCAAILIALTCSAACAVTPERVPMPGAATQLVEASPSAARAPRAMPEAPARRQVTLADFSVVEVRGTALPNARNDAEIGRERAGGGIVIDAEGLVLTIGYLVVETEKIEIVSTGGKRFPASLVAYDSATGLGLIRAAIPLPVQPITFAESKEADISEPVLIASLDGVAPAYIVARREFAGAWEYLLDDALFTAPATTGWSGAALINRDGQLLGVGSLLVMDALGASRPLAGNMFVPIDVLKPILHDMLEDGKPATPPRPWLGVNVQEMQGRLLVTSVSQDGPADRSGVAPGDIIIGLGGQAPAGLADFYRRLWDSGTAGTEIRLEVLKGNRVESVVVKTMENARYLRSPASY